MTESSSTPRELGDDGVVQGVVQGDCCTTCHIRHTALLGSARPFHFNFAFKLFNQDGLTALTRSSSINVLCLLRRAFNQ